MSMDYRLKKNVPLVDLIDGRLEEFGVWEQFVPGATSDDAKCLSNGEDHLWAYADRDGFVESLTVYGRPGNGSILAAIERTFGTEIFSAAIGRAHVFFLKSRNHARRANAGEAGRKA
jgi:hypothetical protein